MTGLGSCWRQQGSVIKDLVGIFHTSCQFPVEESRLAPSGAHIPTQLSS